MREEKLGVALTKELCPVCTKEYDGSILMNSILDKREADKVKELHGKVTGVLEKPCTDCIDKLNGEEAIYLIGVDSEKTTGNEFQDIYRSGHIIALRTKAFKEIFDNHPIIDFGLKNGFTFVDYRILEHLSGDFKNES